MKKEGWWTIGIILGVILLSYSVLTQNKPTTSKEIAKCIGENSVLYVQLGCSHCKDQEDLFGENYQYLNVVDCFYEREICAERISEGGSFSTPTWMINGKKVIGVQSIETLQEITGC